MKNRHLTLQEAAIALDYEAFTLALQRGENVSARGINGNTILHILALHKFENTLVSGVSSFFKPKPGLFDWFLSIGKNLQGTKFENFATEQNDLGDTCMHVAIRNGSWNFAREMSSQCLNYGINPQFFRENRAGLNEYEFFILCYGMLGKEKEFKEIFSGYSPTLNLSHVKRASKAFKIIAVTDPETDDKKTYFLRSSDKEFFRKATEDEYPSPYASFPDRKTLREFLAARGYPPSKESQNMSVGLSAKWDLEPYTKLPQFENLDKFLEFLIEWSEFMGIDYDDTSQRNFFRYAFTKEPASPNEHALTELLDFRKSRKSPETPSYELIFDTLIALWK